MSAPLVSGERFYTLGEANLIKELFLKASEVFESFGYDYVNLSHFEPQEWQEVAFREKAKEAITFKDTASKESFALRLDFTTQVVRTFSGLRDVNLPLRVYYFGSVFSLSKRGYEKLQTGVELLGEKGIPADVEVIELITELLKKLGFKELRVILSHAGIPKKLTNGRQELLRAFLERDTQALRDILGDNTERFLALTSSPSDISFLSSLGLEEELKELLRAGEELRSAGLEFVYDLCEVRSFPYYTGIVFEVFSPEGGALAGGGRYDNLSRVFGKELPATGGAVYLEKLLELLPAKKPKKDYYVVDVSKRGVGKHLARVLRSLGKKVGVDLGKRSPQRAIHVGFESGYGEVLLVEEERIKVYSSPGEWVTMSVKEFLELIK
ncbi:MAG: hypothetical protein GXO04_06165 [Aquificae bacterium]|nr:hypothetical protein [Aquificota bacterium]